KKVVEHICELSAGPCKYSGDSMKLSHQGLDIREAEFYGMVQHLRDALDKAGVPQGAKNELLKILAPMKRDIVTR
ncbi:MAG: group 1 truncated hemoglobin, partial [Betaproteobacteria bacterium]|nr:group 1 truncated hemoglobin [Betaproteobacteria bacterium]